MVSSLVSYPKILCTTRWGFHCWKPKPQRHLLPLCSMPPRPSQRQRRCQPQRHLAMSVDSCSIESGWVFMGFHGISMGFLWDFYGISMGFYRNHLDVQYLTNKSPSQWRHHLEMGHTIPERYTYSNLKKIETCKKKKN